MKILSRVLFFGTALVYVQTDARVHDATAAYIVPYKPTHSQIPLSPLARKSSFPYISGDAFREICNFIIDETKIPFQPCAVKEGDTIFVNGDCLSYFFSTIHPLIQARYILVTHNSDYNIPGAYAEHLEDHKLGAWFGQNVITEHPKMHPLPIGLANKCWKHGDPEVFNKALRSFKPRARAKKLLYMNFTITHPDRVKLYEQFFKQPFCTTRTLNSALLGQLAYLYDVAHHHFVLCPAGNGLDTHRTWESLLMRAIPVVHTSASDSLYDDLPVLIVHNWQEVTAPFLYQKYEEMRRRTYNFKKLYAPYWINSIHEVQAALRKHTI